MMGIVQLLKKIKDTDPELLTSELEQEIQDASNISKLKTISAGLNLELVPRAKKKICSTNDQEELLQAHFHANEGLNASVSSAFIKVPFGLTYSH